MTEEENSTREFSRARVRMRVKVKGRSNEIVQGSVRDVSMNGIFVELPKHSFELDEHCMVHVILEGC